jgi:hypothetical protein
VGSAEGQCLKQTSHWRVLSSRDITPCSPLSQLTFRRQTASLLRASYWFLTWVTLQLWRGRWHVPSKRRLTFNGQHAVTSQKKNARTSNLTTFEMLTTWKETLPKKCLQSFLPWWLRRVGLGLLDAGN